MRYEYRYFHVMNDELDAFLAEWGGASWRVHTFTLHLTRPGWHVLLEREIEFA